MAQDVDENFALGGLPHRMSELAQFRFMPSPVAGFQFGKSETAMSLTWNYFSVV